jgi:hypothetical protein
MIVRWGTGLILIASRSRRGPAMGPATRAPDLPSCSSQPSGAKWWHACWKALPHHGTEAESAVVARPQGATLRCRVPRPRAKPRLCSEPAAPRRGSVLGVVGQPGAAEQGRSPAPFERASECRSRVLTRFRGPGEARSGSRFWPPSWLTSPLVRSHLKSHRTGRNPG